MSRHLERIEYHDATSALLALAMPEEVAKYNDDLAYPARVDDYGDEHRLEPHLKPILLERLMEKLRSGEWIASGFGFESGQPTDLHPRLWQRMIINVGRNSAHDGVITLGGKSLTGSFHSLAFRPVASGNGPSRASLRAEAIDELKVYFELIDNQLPESASKKHFFRKAREKFGVRAVDGWMRKAWTEAQLRPSRRLPGSKAIESI